MEIKPCKCIDCQKAYSDGYKEGFNEASKPAVREKMLRVEPIIIPNIRHAESRPLVELEEDKVRGLMTKVEVGKMAMFIATKEGIEYLERIAKAICEKFGSPKEVATYCPKCGDVITKNHLCTCLTPPKEVEVCPSCGGSGEEYKGEPDYACSKCGGHGELPTPPPTSPSKDDVIEDMAEMIIDVAMGHHDDISMADEDRAVECAEKIYNKYLQAICGGKE